MKGAQGRHVFLRPLILRATFAFWSTRDADLWINQRFLVKSILQAIPRLDKDTARTALEELVDEGVLLRRRPSPRRSVYRQAATFCDPTSVGYSREIDELLVDPMSWVTAKGQFLRVGRAGEGVEQDLYPVASFPHHFSKHVWMRAWIHAFDLGLFSEPARALKAVAQAARGSPWDYLCHLWQEGEMARLGERFPELRRATTWRALEQSHEPRLRAPAAWPDRTAGDRGEQALALLHELCGHDHLRRLTLPALGTPRQGRLLEDDVHLGLDAMARRRLEGMGLAPNRVSRGFGPIPKAGPRPQLDPLLARHEAQIRALEPSLRASLTDHRIAWPGGLLALNSPKPSA